MAFQGFLIVSTCFNLKFNKGKKSSTVDKLGRIWQSPVLSKGFWRCLNDESKASFAKYTSPASSSREEPKRGGSSFRF
jgi:hypothetical protein